MEGHRGAVMPDHPQRLALPAPPELAQLVRYIHIEQHSGGMVTVPATPHAMLTFFLAGATLPAEGLAPSMGRAMLSGPLTMPHQVYWLPGSTFVTVLLAPEYLPMLFGIDAGTLADRPVALDDTPLRLEAASLQDALLSQPGPREWAASICRWLSSLLERSKHGAPFAVPPQLLWRDTLDIAAQFGLGTRQFERRYLAAYGQTLRASRKMQRYAQVLATLLRTRPGHGALTTIAADAGYHDQAHMIRDFTRFTSMSPRALARAVAGSDAALRLLRYDEPGRELVFAPS